MLGVYVLGSVFAGPVCLAGNAACLADEDDCPDWAKCGISSGIVWGLAGGAGIVVGIHEKDVAVGLESGAVLAVGISMIVVGAFNAIRSSDEDEQNGSQDPWLGHGISSMVTPTFFQSRDRGLAPGVAVTGFW
ncbi:hypothetical protein ACFL6C_07685 [Myxococcota bacterium]